MNRLNLPGPKAQALIERDKNVISSSYPRGYPFVMDHGKGVEVWDPDGNRFVDFMSGIAVLSTFMARREGLQARDGVGVEIVGPHSSEATRQLVEFARRTRVSGSGARKPPSRRWTSGWRAADSP